MNFFDHQDRARRSAVYRMLLTIAIVLSPVIFGTCVWAQIDEADWQVPVVICGVMLPFMAAGYWYQNRKLKGGGSAIAERFGGYLISLDPHEDDRWLLDIVEQMAIASGNPVPLVYLLDTRGVNAFAAGRTPQDSAICLTLGALYILNYEEVQAVVAHLFSQIYNNDMRVDARMTGVYSGIACLALLIGLAGGFMFVVGMGWIYLAFLAMSRVLRQRKYLADASAAQFTRNPQSVASALKKIGGYEYGSVISCREQEDFLQMFFAMPYNGLGKRLVSPHPPLKKRIQRLDPDWDGEYPDVPPLESLVGDDELAEENRRRWDILGAVTASAFAVNDAGEEPAYLYQAQVSLSKIPDEIRAAARHTDGAQVLIYRLLLCAQPDVRDQQLKLINAVPDPVIAHYMQVLEAPMRDLDRYLRLPLFDLCIPALKQLPADEYEIFTNNMRVLAGVDGRTYVMGWALLHILNAQVLQRPKAKSKYTLAQREEDVTLLLWLVANTGHRSEAQMELAYYRACDVLPFYTAPVDWLREGEGLERFDKPFKRLQQLKPDEKEILMEAVAVCIENDGHITPEEIELMRAIADILDCPMPEGLETPSIETADATPLLA